MRTEDIYEKVKKYIEKNQMITSGDRIVVGVSGGADSVCLLYMLWELSKEIHFRLVAVHVHHGVRAEADEDAAYTGQLCQQLGVPFFLKRVDMYAYAKENSLSPEEAGRQLRYQAFEEVLSEEGGGKIAVAHNNNDRAETMLFHLFRGSGLKGLCGIRPVRRNIIRPLLCLERTEIEAYLAEKEIAFCIDCTNDEDTYTRNKIRHHILPYAETQICKNASAHMGETADILMEAEDFLQKQTVMAYDRCVESLSDFGVVIQLPIFRKEEPFLQKMLLLYVFEQITPYRKDITKEHVEALIALMEKEGSREVDLPYGLTAYKEYDRLTICPRKPENDKEQISFPVSVPGRIEVPEFGIFEFECLSKDTFFYKKGQIIPEKTYTKWFDYDKITKTLVLRTRKTGDYLTIDNALRKQSVKDYMVNEKIPKAERNQLFLLAEEEHVLWIPGYRISQYYKVDENTKRILQVQIRGGR
ncbi:MAG: tRNA lysidine(34) synthetase TilS [Lachnospiraceae bacterium]|nr:tRNA lysidine(34) synthetase TilS [Lachnospiraceae bacterium]